MLSPFLSHPLAFFYHCHPMPLASLILCHATRALSSDFLAQPSAFHSPEKSFESDRVQCTASFSFLKSKQAGQKHIFNRGYGKCADKISYTVALSFQYLIY